GVELDAAAVGAEVEFADAERRGRQLEFGDGEQVLGGVGQEAKAVDHLDLEFLQAFAVAGGGDALVEGEAGVDVGQVVVRDQGGGVQFDLGAVRLGGVHVRDLALA